VLRPLVTSTQHVLPFDRLSSEEFERLCLQLLSIEGFDDLEHLGPAGNEQGRDIVAHRNGMRWAFQCKRVSRFGPADALAEIRKLRSLPATTTPSRLVFMVSCHVSALTRDRARASCPPALECLFWSVTELDAKVRAHERLVQQFFGFPWITDSQSAATGLATPRLAGQLLKAIRTLSIDDLRDIRVDHQLSTFTREVITVQDTSRLAAILSTHPDLATDNPHLVQLFYVASPSGTKQMKGLVRRLLANASDYHLRHHASLALNTWGDKHALPDYLSFVRSNDDADQRDTLEYVRYYGSLDAAVAHTLRKIRRSPGDSLYRVNLAANLHMVGKIALPEYADTIICLRQMLRSASTRKLLDEAVDRILSRYGVA
jgi:Restriction endonuclease